MRLRVLAIGFGWFIGLNGVALAVVGVWVVSESPAAGIMACVAGFAIAIYGFRLVDQGRQGTIPEWIKDLTQSAPL